MAGLIRREVGENNTFSHKFKIIGLDTFEKLGAFNKSNQ